MNKSQVGMENNRQSTPIIKTNYKPWLVSLILLFFDLLSIVLSYLISFEIRRWLIPVLGGLLDISTIYPIFWLSLLLIIGLFMINGLYPGVGRTGIVEIKEIFLRVTIAYISSGLAMYVFGFGSLISRTVFLLSWAFSLVFISIFRVFFHNRGSLLSWWNMPVLIVGNRKDVENVIIRMQRARRMAFNPVIAMIFDKDFLASSIKGVPAYPYSISMQEEIRKSGVTRAIIANQGMEIKQNQKKDIYGLSLSFPKLIYVMGESPLSTLSMKTFDFEGRPALQVQYNLLTPWTRWIKRVIDLVFCVLGSVFIIPLFGILALLIRIDSPGPILFTQKRMGKDGKIFDLYKFRTMEADAEEKLNGLLESDESIREEFQKYHKLHRDPRITRIGRFLRKISLDEFPQIINVIRGEMSLVGPRAYLPSEKEDIGDYAELIHRVRPGLTGYWQVMGRHDVSFKERLRMDEYYISNFSLWMDFYIMCKTIWIVISGKGA